MPRVGGERDRNCPSQWPALSIGRRGFEWAERHRAAPLSTLRWLQSRRMDSAAIQLPPTLPLLPLRNCVLLPSSVRSVVLASAKSIKLVEEHIARGSSQEFYVGVVPLIKNGDGNEEIHTTGVAARVLSTTKTSTPRR